VPWESLEGGQNSPEGDTPRWREGAKRSGVKRGRGIAVISFY